MTADTSLVPSDPNADKVYFFPVAEEDVPDRLKDSFAKWQALGRYLDYQRTVLWRVEAGFRLKEDVRKAGPCDSSFSYLRSWALVNDEPTTSCYVFFIPRIVEQSTKKNHEEQIALLADIAQRYGLPRHHLSNLGSAAMICGLIFANLESRGEKTPLRKWWVRTDTFHTKNLGLSVGGFGAGLCLTDSRWDEDRDEDLGCFPIGVEPDPPAEPSGQ